MKRFSLRDSSLMRTPPNIDIVANQNHYSNDESTLWCIAFSPSDSLSCFFLSLSLSLDLYE